MPARKILISVLECDCQECSHHWVTKDNVLPEICPSCKSLNWNEPDQLSEDDLKEFVGEKG